MVIHTYNIIYNYIWSDQNCMLQNCCEYLRFQCQLNYCFCNIKYSDYLVYLSININEKYH